MAYEPKPGTGSLFKNKRKEKDTHPDYRGDLVLPDGTKMELVAWLKATRAGDKFLSLKLSEPREKPKPEGDAARQEPERSVITPSDPFDDEIPF